MVLLVFTSSQLVTDGHLTPINKDYFHTSLVLCKPLSRASVVPMASVLGIETRAEKNTGADKLG